MFNKALFSLIILFIAAFGAGMLSAEMPVTVSPGDLKAVAPIAGGLCPTFSWSVIQDAEAFEIVVFQLDEAVLLREVARDNAPSPILKVRIPGAATSWTPMAAQCLERDREYAWTVRAIGRRGPSEWSTARLFSTPKAPSVAEVEEALEVLREYVKGNRETGAAPELSRPVGPTAPEIADTPEDEPELRAAPPTETSGIVSDLDSTLTAYAVRGISRSSANSSSGVLGEATSPTGITYGVTGTNVSSVGAGVRGVASNPSGDSVGVYGFTFSNQGAGGLFETMTSGAAGLYARAATNSDADLILGGTSPTNDDGTMRSEPSTAGSDLHIRSNDEIVLQLNHDGTAAEDSDLWVRDAAGDALLNVDDGGTVRVYHELRVDGSVAGVLVDQADIDAALLAHEIHYHPLRIFVTSETYQGNLDGLDGGDAECQARADAAGLPGTFIAWLSGNDSSKNVLARLDLQGRPYYLPSGHKVADSGGDLLDGSLDHAINRDEFGALVTSNATAYTNTKPGGGFYANTTDCGPEATEWTSSAYTESGRYGNINSTTSTWTSAGNTGCDNWRRLYCVQE